MAKGWQLTAGERAGSRGHGAGSARARPGLLAAPPALALVAALTACPTAEGGFDLLVCGTGASAQSVELEISGIAIDADGGGRWTILDVARVLEIDAETRTSIGRVQLPAGDYVRLKVELGAIFIITLEDGTTVDREWPDLLQYVRGGDYLAATEENGFDDTNRYFIFSTDNGMLDEPIAVAADQVDGEVEIMLEPRYPVVDDVGYRAALAAGLKLSL